MIQDVIMREIDQNGGGSTHITRRRRYLPLLEYALKHAKARPPAPEARRTKCPGFRRNGKRPRAGLSWALETRDHLSKSVLAHAHGRCPGKHRRGPAEERLFSR